MKTCSLSSVARIIGLTSLLMVLLALLYGSIRADGIIPTNQWVDFFSANTTLRGQPVPVGTVIAAFGPQGVQCGEFIVRVEGQYGLMPCYGDDPTTPEDEGAEPGDVISFTMNGLPATPVPISLNGNPVPPSTRVTWTKFGDRWEVDLQVVAPLPPPGPVGGIIVPVNRLELLALRLRSGQAPWIGLAALTVAGVTAVVVRRLKS